MFDHIVKFFEFDIAAFFASKDFFTICFFTFFSILFYYFSFRSFSIFVFGRYIFYFGIFYLYSYFDANILFLIEPLLFNFVFHELASFAVFYFEGEGSKYLSNLIWSFKKRVFILFLLYQILVFIFLKNVDISLKLNEGIIFLFFFMFALFVYKLKITLENRKQFDLSYKIVEEVFNSFLFITLAFILFFYSAFNFKYKFYLFSLSVVSFVVFRFLELQLIGYCLYFNELYSQYDLLKLINLLYFALRIVVNLVFAFYMLLLWKVNIFEYLVFLEGEILVKIFSLLFLSFSSVSFVYLGNFITKKWVQDKKRNATYEFSARLETLFNILNIVFKILISIFFFGYSLNIFGIGINYGFLSTFTAAGFGLGFGFKNLLDDFISGLCLMFEDTFNLGDIVIVADITGKVEDITLRVLRIRDFEGGLHTIPFRKVEVVCNKSKTYVYAIFSVAVDQGAKTADVMEAIKETGRDFRERYKSKVLEDIEVIGPTEIVAGGIIYEARIKMIPINLRLIKPDFYVFLKAKFDAFDIKFASGNFNYVHLLKKK